MAASEIREAMDSASRAGLHRKHGRRALQGGCMIRIALGQRVLCVASEIILSAVMAAQTKPVPRPAALPPGQQPPGERAAPDGYQPLPAWLGQTRAPAPAKTETFTVETFTEGLN